MTWQPPPQTHHGRLLYYWGYHCQGKYHVFCFVLILREREREFYSFGQYLLHRYFWVHLWPPALQVRLRLCKTIFFGCIYGAFFFFFFFYTLNLTITHHDLTTTATNTSWPPALLLRLRLQYSTEENFSISWTILLFTFSCPIYQAYWMTTIIIWVAMSPCETRFNV